MLWKQVGEKYGSEEIDFGDNPHNRKRLRRNDVFWSQQHQSATVDESSGSDDEIDDDDDECS